MDLFSAGEEDPTQTEAQNSAAAEYFHPGDHSPLAVRMRPRSLDEVCGQQHVLGEGTPLRRLISGQGDSSVILYGPPGTGKTTIASLISSAAGRRFVALSALDSGVKEVRAVIADARRRLVHGQNTVLFIDEVHRFSKTQQDALLAAVENRTVLLVAATTENPSFAVVGPLLSRCLLIQLQPLSDADIAHVLRQAVADPRGYGGAFALPEDSLKQLVALAGGDARRSLTYLEAAAEDLQQHIVQPGSVTNGSRVADADSEPDAAKPQLTTEIIARAIDRAIVRYDRDGDQHYDITSALIKSIRGSDPDAALHYLARMVEGGEDPRFLSRRLVILASEDIGLADPTALPTAVAAHQAVSFIGLPEARITLAHAVVHLATAPKSNAAYQGLNRAIADIRQGKGRTVPAHLRDGHYSGAKKLGHALNYHYPHDDPRGVLEQQYLPDDLASAIYYEPTEHGHERTLKNRLRTLRGITRGQGS